MSVTIIPEKEKQLAHLVKALEQAVDRMELDTNITGVDVSVHLKINDEVPDGYTANGENCYLKVLHSDDGAPTHQIYIYIPD